MLSAKKLAITWGDNPEYWSWIPIRLKLYRCCSMYVGLRSVAPRTRFLSRRTRFSVYVVFKKVDIGYGFKNVPIKAEVGVVGQEISMRYVCFDKEEDAEEEDAEEEDAEEEDAEEEERTNLLKPEERGDGWWMEIELGEFFNEGGLMNRDEIEDLNWKQGLIIEGIEMRPAK